MEAFKVSHLGRVAGLNQRFETRFNQRGQTTAKDSLLAEQISFGFLPKVCFNDACSTSANCRGIGKADFSGILVRILVNGKQAGNTGAAREFMPHQMTRSLRS